ncbi:MAG: hypothetical protein JSV99_09090, partial [Planctomycetota bacterium]
MFRRLISLMAVALLLCMGGSALGTTYYVSPDGSDLNSGTSPTDAWQSIDKVNDVSFGDGDNIFFECGGTFSGSLYFDATDGGTITAPLTVGSYVGNYGSDRPTISSGDADGIHVRNRAAFVIQDLSFVGTARLDKGFQ